MVDAVAVAHDYLTQKGGAERVVSVMARAFPGAPIYTSLYDPKRTFDFSNSNPVVTSFLNRASFLRARHRFAFLLYPMAFGRMRVEAEVVICSSSGWAQGVRTSGRKILYCHSPARWLYSPQHYLRNTFAAGKALLLAARPYLKRWDQATVRSCSAFLANSTLVREQLEEIYAIEAEVLHPPLTLEISGPEKPVEGVDDPFVLLVARLVPHKNIDVVMEAFRNFDHKLVVVGSGPLLSFLKKKAHSKVSLVGEVTDEQLRWLYRRCSAVVSAAFEDFGLTPVEAAAFGKPSVVLRYGGHLDTVIEGNTGVFFNELKPRAIQSAVARTIARAWDKEILMAHAAAFSVERFVTRLREIVDEVRG